MSGKKETLVSLNDLVPDNKTGPLNKKEIKLVHKWIEADWEAADVDDDVLRLIKRLLETIEDLKEDLFREQNAHS